MRPLGVAHFSAIDVPPAEFVSMAAEAGFDAVGLRLFPAFPGAPFYPLPEGSDAAREVAARLDGTGLRVADVEFVVIDRQFDAERLGPALADAAALGAVSVSVCGDDPEPSRLTESLARLCEIAGAVGLRVDLENMGWRHVATFDDAMATVEACGAGNAATLVDALHFFRNGGAIDALKAAPSSRLRHIQLCDVRGPAPVTDEARMAEARSGRFAPGEGELPLAALVAATPSAAALSVEVPLPAGMAPPAHLAKLARYARHLLGAD